MPNYYNPYLFNSNPYLQQPANFSSAAYTVPPVKQNFMFSVDGEVAAKVWQPPGNYMLGAGEVVPLWDVDGYHVYFKSTDAYGRMNPLRKAHIIFDDDTAGNIGSGQMQNNSQAPSDNISQDTANFVTKEDLENLRKDIQHMLSQMQMQGKNVSNTSINQNGKRPSGGDVR